MPERLAHILQLLADKAQCDTLAQLTEEEHGLHPHKNSGKKQPSTVEQLWRADDMLLIDLAYRLMPLAHHRRVIPLRKGPVP